MDPIGNGQEDGENAREPDLARLRRETQIGINQADRGMTMPLTEELVQDIKALGRGRLASRQGRSIE